MSVIAIILGLAIVGLVLWLVVTYIPMPEPYKRALVIIVVVIVILWLLRVLGLMGNVVIPSTP